MRKAIQKKAKFDIMELNTIKVSYLNIHFILLMSYAIVILNSVTFTFFLSSTMLYQLYSLRSIVMEAFLFGTEIKKNCAR